VVELTRAFASRACERLFTMGDTGWLVPTLRVFACAMVNISLKVSTDVVRAVLNWGNQR